MRPELPTSIESLLRQVRPGGGHFSASKQQVETSGFANLLVAGTAPATQGDVVPAAVPVHPAGDILPPAGKALPGGRTPPPDPAGPLSPPTDTAVEPAADVSTESLALMLEDSGSVAVPAGMPPVSRQGSDGAASEGSGEGKPAEARPVTPVVAPVVVPPSAGPDDGAGSTTNVAARAIPVAAPPLPQDPGRAPAPSKRATPPLAVAATGDAGRPLPETRIEVAPAASGRPQPVPSTDDAALRADAATRSVRDALVPMATAAPVPRPAPSDATVRARPAGEAGHAIDRLPAAATDAGQGLQAGGPARAADPAVSAPATTARDSISVPVQDPAWDSALSERVVMMSRDQRHSAELRLSPADLGPLRVQLTVEDGKADVSFHVQHGVTRDAIEQALPRLREMLADNGLQLGRCDVGDAGTQDRAASRDARPAPSAPPGTADAEDDGTTAPATTLREARGLIDTFV